MSCSLLHPWQLKNCLAWKALCEYLWLEMCDPEQLCHWPEPLPSPPATCSPETAVVENGGLLFGISEPERIPFCSMCVSKTHLMPRIRQSQQDKWWFWSWVFFFFSTRFIYKRLGNEATVEYQEGGWLTFHLIQLCQTLSRGNERM